MIQVLLVRSKDGLLQSCSAQGHAGFAAKGKDIVCAAVTSLLRTALAVLENKSSIVLDENSSDRGFLAFSVKGFTSDDESLLRYSFEFLQEGLGQIAQDYPKCIKLRVEE
ncbi:MAG: ribosomal-processing cysteine protease Prp [Treponemataceae bacterium]|nr:ribosomal-processing cysteine protease Prp [Treponemataceae bacterium]